MHEMSIAESIVQSAAAEARQRPGMRVRAVGLRIGEYAGVDRGSLEFCFEALVKGTELEGAHLEIDTPKGSSDLDLLYLEVDEPNDQSPAGEEGTQ
jgi:hydrogenase nickel incorporation protein HypA/HybF